MRIKPSRSRGDVLGEARPGNLRLPGREPDAPELLRLGKILVPIDFSDCSKKALRYALALARQFQAELLCLHVIDIPYGTSEAGLVVEMQRYRSKLQGEGKRSLAELVRAEAGDISAKPLMRSGTAHQEITRAAGELNADLIVISTHGRTGLGRFLLGSTTERVVRHAPCPVLVVREHEHDFIATPEQAASSPTVRKAR